MRVVEENLAEENPRGVGTAGLPHLSERYRHAFGAGVKPRVRGTLLSETVRRNYPPSQLPPRRFSLSCFSERYRRFCSAADSDFLSALFDGKMPLAARPGFTSEITDKWHSRVATYGQGAWGDFTDARDEQTPTSLLVR